jgi:hypothetical protein
MRACGWSTAVQGCPSLLRLTLWWWCPGCAAGKELSNGICQPCLAGTYSAQISTAPCTTCPPGSTSPAGASTCGEPPAAHFIEPVALSSNRLCRNYYPEQHQQPQVVVCTSSWTSERELLTLFYVHCFNAHDRIHWRCHHPSRSPHMAVVPSAP